MARRSDNQPESPAVHGWCGTVLLVLSAAGAPLMPLLPRRGGRWGGLLVEGACGTRLARDLIFAASGAPARLRPLPRLLLHAEITTVGVATCTGLCAWVWPAVVAGRVAEERTGRRVLPLAARWSRQGRAGARGHAAAAGVATIAAATFVLHTARFAIYLSPGHGRQAHTAALSPGTRPERGPVRHQPASRRYGGSDE
jgi:hypothetical protein